MGEMALQQFNYFIRLDIVYYNTSKVGLKKISQETVKISRNIDPSKAIGDPQVLVQLLKQLLKSTNGHSRTVSLASLGRPARRLVRPGSPIHVVSTLVYMYTVHCHCNTRSSPSRSCVRYSDKLPMKITCNC